jgi:glycosyltransferase involved in cell wall biosynthesis
MGGQKNNIVALVTPNLDAYSETFIRAQIDFLSPKLVLHTGRLPTMAGKKELLGNFQKRVNYYGKKLFHKDFFSLEKRIETVLKEHNIGIVLAQYGPTGVAMMPICKKLDLPLVVHFHGLDASRFDILSKYEKSYKEMFAFVKAVIVVSRAMAEKITELGCPPEKIKLNYYGVNDLFFKSIPSYASNNFIAAGRFVEKKGPEFTIRAFSKVVQQFPQAKLFMIGNGPLLEICRKLARDLSMEKSIFFPGVVRHDLMAGYMEKSLAFVQHSMTASNGDSEGTPVAILEASAAALPVISTVHAGIPDVVIDGITGFLVKEKDIDGMSLAMLKILADKNLAAEMGKSGRQRILSGFTMSNYCSVLKKVLEA